MKQEIAIGAMVDDGTGDYLRKGGIKINENFDELYFQLGDGETPHAAGAWKNYETSQGSILKAEFGHSYTIDTSGGAVSVELPKGSTLEYNFVIRLRDVFSTWALNPVTVSAAVGDTLKGSSTPVTFATDFQDLELVYCAPGRWEYVTNKLVNRITSSDMATVATQQYIATEGQTDFMDVFDSYTYNTANLKVYHRGNLLFYGKDDVFDPATSEFGSPGTAPGELVELDGKNIRLRMPCVEGDTVIITSFNDGIGQFRSSYNKRTIRVLDASLTNDKTVNGSLIVADLKTKLQFTDIELGIAKGAGVNASACEVAINGIELVRAGTAGLPTFYCDGADADNPTACSLAGGTWTQSAEDFDFEEEDETNDVIGINFGTPLEHGDVITIAWYNNNIGTTLELDDIVEEINGIFVSQGPSLNITGDVRITDETNPFAPNVEPVTESVVKASSALVIFDLLYPVGSIYENGVNPNNPTTYMGFGVWKRLENTVLVGWSADSGSKFHFNNNDIDSLGNPSATAGGTGGSTNFYIKDSNIPKLSTDQDVLIKDDNGSIVIGGCMVDPDAQGPAYTKYREDKATINEIQTPNALPVDHMPPYLVVHRWMRIA